MNMEYSCMSGNKSMFLPCIQKASKVFVLEFAINWISRKLLAYVFQLKITSLISQVFENHEFDRVLIFELIQNMEVQDKAVLIWLDRNSVLKAVEKTIERRLNTVDNHLSSVVMVKIPVDITELHQINGKIS